MLEGSLKGLEGHSGAGEATAENSGVRQDTQGAFGGKYESGSALRDPGGHWRVRRRKLGVLVGPRGALTAQGSAQGAAGPALRAQPRPELPRGAAGHDGSR